MRDVIGQSVHFHWSRLSFRVISCGARALINTQAVRKVKAGRKAMPVQPRRLPNLQPERRRRRLRVALIITCCCVLMVLVLALGLHYIIKHVNSRLYYCAQSAVFIPIESVCDGRFDCAAGEDELRCVSRFRTNGTYSVRLVSESLVLQVLLKGEIWSTVCADNWRTQHTQLACQQLGYTQTPRSIRLPVRSLHHNLRTVFSAISIGKGGRSDLHDLLGMIDQCTSDSVISLSCSDCGEVDAAGRIVGGSDTAVESWPWQAGLRWDKRHMCGGSLISARWIISAAHCFTGKTKDVSRWNVVLGQTYMTSSGAVSVESIVVNHAYNPVSHDYDIAMVRLASDVRPGATVRPVCLPPYQLPIMDTDELVVTGWGLLQENAGQLSNVLQKARVHLINSSVCSNASIYGSAITPRMLCAGFLEGGVDSCHGDSGGPLVFLSTRWQLVGVASWGSGCARKGRPGVYTDIRQLLNWVYNIMNKYP